MERMQRSHQEQILEQRQKLLEYQVKEERLRKDLTESQLEIQRLSANIEELSGKDAVSEREIPSPTCEVASFFLNLRGPFQTPFEI